MALPDREKLNGRIEVYETYVEERKSGGKRGRGSGGKEIIVFAVEVLTLKADGRVRLRRIQDVTGSSLVPFVSDVVENRF